ncbi:hypothetical protein G6F22_017257 [Rhizopus arrhizus]|nr:hypothetical protein G6F22_017257 [Rhizopus arrhizus]
MCRAKACSYGTIKTDHILFIASGAFHLAKPSDLIPELQGRFPIRVELGALSKNDFVRILTEPKAALTKQYEALLATEGVKVSFTADAIERLAEIAFQVNERQENIGARRLHTVRERLLDSVSYEAPDREGETLAIDSAYVDAHLGELVQDPDLSRYILASTHDVDSLSGAVGPQYLVDHRVGAGGAEAGRGRASVAA